MARSKSDISNSAIRIFLQEVGKFYDEKRGFTPYKGLSSQKKEILEYFNYSCCYCGVEINDKNLSQDHLIPMNKEVLGLHAWGNVVPCCGPCNNLKQQKDWVDFLKQKTLTDQHFKERKNRISEFVKKYNYNSKLNIHKYAENLYQDVGEVAMALINLRYKQAADTIQNDIKD